MKWVCADTEVLVCSFCVTSTMGKIFFVPSVLCVILAFWSVFPVKAEDAYRFYTWTVTYGTASPLGVPQQVSLVISILAACVFFHRLYSIGQQQKRGKKVKILSVVLFSNVSINVYQTCRSWISESLMFEFEGHSDQWSISWSET